MGIVLVHLCKVHSPICHPIGWAVSLWEMLSIVKGCCEDFMQFCNR